MSFLSCDIRHYNPSIYYLVNDIHHKSQQPVIGWRSYENQPVHKPTHGVGLCTTSSCPELFPGVRRHCANYQPFRYHAGTQGQVLIDGQPSPIADWADTLIVAYVPETARLAAVTVQVLTRGGNSNTVSLTVTTRQSNGRVKWRFQHSGMYTVVRPAVGPDGTVYVVDVGSHLYALSPDGALKWIVRGAGYKGLAVGADESNQYGYMYAIDTAGTTSPTPTPGPTNTPVTNTPVPPKSTSTPVPATPTHTPIINTSVPSTPTNTPVSPTLTHTPAGSISTGFLSPSANAAQTSGAGNNNGYQTGAANAYANDSAVTTDTDSGTNKSTSCTYNGKDKHHYYNYLRVRPKLRATLEISQPAELLHYHNRLAK